MLKSLNIAKKYFKKPPPYFQLKINKQLIIH